MYDFLIKVIESERVVTVITTNGYHMRGKIKEYDNAFRTIIMEVDGNEQLVFVSAISTIK